MLLKLIYLSCALMMVLLTTKIYALAADTAVLSSSTQQEAKPPEGAPTPVGTAAPTVGKNLCANGGCDAPPAPPKAGQHDAPKTAAEMASPLAQDLVARQHELDQEQENLAARQRLVDAASEALERRMRALSEQQNQLAEAQQHVAALSHDDTDRLVRIYEAMRPVDAAAIFNVLDLHVSVPLLRQMSPRKTSAIMALMSPQRAILATQLLVSGPSPKGAW